MSTIRHLPILPQDMIQFGCLLMAYPPEQRRAECRRILDAVMTGAAVYSRGLHMPVGTDWSLASAIFRERDAQQARGWTLGRWGDNPHEHMVCMALACEMAADVMQAEAKVAA
jgi:hypothetical protein